MVSGLLCARRCSFQVLLVAIVCMAASAKADVTADREEAAPVLPRPQMLFAGKETVDLSGGVSIISRASAGVTGAYAAQCLSRELHRLFGIASTLGEATSREDDVAVHVVLAASHDPALAELLADAANAANAAMPGPGGYLMSIAPARRRAVVVGADGIGVVRGVFALANHARLEQGRPRWTRVLFTHTPDMPIRLTRGIFSGDRKPDDMDARDLERIQLDWWARWGLNHTFLPSDAKGDKIAQQDYARWYLREAHDRGMRVGVNLGGRSLCASDDDAVRTYVDEAARLLSTGCDFVQVLFDDLPSTRTAGHCKRCVKRFGGSLAREQRHILEALQEVVEGFGPEHRLIWCPTYYSRGMTGYRDAAEGPEAYFTILGASPAVRNAWMYHCAFDGAFTAFLDAKGLTRRIWWYNGIRTPYYMVNREFDGFEGWGRRLVIPGLKDFESFFSPFENGWLMPTFASADPSRHPCVAPLVTAKRDADERTLIPQSSWDELHQIASRYDGMYYCGASSPYHIAMSGIFAARPADFDQSRAARTVLAAMFGPAAVDAVINWQAAYERCQLILAKAEGKPLTEKSWLAVQDMTERMATREKQARAVVQTGVSALPLPVMEALLEEMTIWRKKVAAMAVEPRSRR